MYKPFCHSRTESLVAHLHGVAPNLCPVIAENPRRTKLWAIKVAYRNFRTVYLSEYFHKSLTTKGKNCLQKLLFWIPYCAAIQQQEGLHMSKMKIHYRGLATLFALVSVSCISLSAASAATITLGESTGSFDFTGNGANSVTVTTAGLTGAAFFDADPTTFGTYTFGPANFLAGPMNSNLFPAGGAAESFSYTATAGSPDSLAGTINWNFIQDNTPQPKFFGHLSITSISGTAAFLANFSQLSALIDFITNPMIGAPTLDALALTTGTATASISSGEVAPVPIPGALALFASGLVGLVALNRKRRKRNQQEPGLPATA